MFNETRTISKTVTYGVDEYTEYLHRFGRLVTKGKDPDDLFRFFHTFFNSTDFVEECMDRDEPTGVMEGVTSLLDLISSVNRDTFKYWRLWFAKREQALILELTFESNGGKRTSVSNCFTVPLGLSLLGTELITFKVN